MNNEQTAAFLIGLLSGIWPLTRPLRANVSVRPPLYGIRKRIYDDKRWNAYLVSLASRGRFSAAGSPAVESGRRRRGTDDTGPR